MAVRWLAILILLIAVVIVYVSSLNSIPVKVVLPLFGESNPTTGLLMITAFSVGIVFALVFFAIRDWRDYFRRMTERKREKSSRLAREYLTRARNTWRVGLMDPAMAGVREALEKDPMLPEAHELMGDMLTKKGDYYGAAASYNQSLLLDRENDDLRWKLAGAYRQAGNLAMAGMVFKDGLAASEKSIYLLVRYRDFLVEQKSWDEAISAQSRLSRIRDYRTREDHRHELAGLNFEKGQDLLEKGQAEDAAKSFEEASKLDQKMSPAYIRMGDAYIAQGKDKNALKIWALGYRRTSDPAIVSRLEEFYLKNNDPSRIINLYLRYIDEKPQDATLRFQFANLLFKLEMLQESQNQLEEVHRILGEDNPQLAHLTYRLKQKMDDTKGAMGELVYLAERCFSGEQKYICVNCQARTAEAADRCPACGRWGSLQRTV